MIGALARRFADRFEDAAKQLARATRRHRTERTGAHPAAATNVCVITDVNRIQNDTFCDDLLPLEPLADKWSSMGWNVLDIDGHDMDAILGALEGAPR